MPLPDDFWEESKAENLPGTPDLFDDLFDKPKLMMPDADGKMVPIGVVSSFNPTPKRVPAPVTILEVDGTIDDKMRKSLERKASLIEQIRESEDRRAIDILKGLSQ